MKSLRELYKTGRGPSSSHTIGPEIIARNALARFGQRRYRVELFGSLALTGRGHGTDRVLREVLGADTDIVFNSTATDIPHPNYMKIYSLSAEGTPEFLFDAVSVGGGSVLIDGHELADSREVYPQRDLAEVRAFADGRGMTLPEYVRYYEPDIYPYLETVWQVMKESVERGLEASGVLGGGLNLERKARVLYGENAKFELSLIHENRKVSAYALAVAEENAANGTVVTAPTCGSAGIVPVGNVVKQNASISGAECGCQAEVGVACSMAAAALAQIYELSSADIECSAEIALEHNLGLTCDPVLGLVQIPCIERNAMASIKAFNAVMLAKSLESKHKVSFDEIVEVMYQTGRDMNQGYRETSVGGLAKIYAEKGRARPEKDL